MTAWIAVAAADHVAIGHAGGFVQVCHGKLAALRRLRPGDRMACYSPTRRLGGGAPVRAFTALGKVADRAPYQVAMVPGFQPFRRDIRWFETQDAPIAPLLSTLLWTCGRALGPGAALWPADDPARGSGGHRRGRAPAGLTAPLVQRRVSR